MKNIKKWVGYKFNQADYNETGYDKKAVSGFTRNFRAMLKKQEGIEDIQINYNYYDVSGFVRGNGKCVYISLPDLRYQDDWVSRILIRTAKDFKDYSGGRNDYTTIEDLPMKISQMLN